MADTWVRTTGAVGFAGVAAAVATIPFAGSSPKSSSNATAIAAYVVAHQAQLRTAGLLVVVSAALFLWFAGSYAWLLHRRDNRSPLWVIALGASVAMTGLLLWDGLLSVAMSYLSRGRVDSSSALVAEYELWNGVVMPGGFGFVMTVFLVATAVSAFRGVIGGKGVGYLAATLALLTVVSGVGGLTTVDGGTNSPVSFAPAASMAIVVVTLSLIFVRGSRQTEDNTTPRPLAASIDA